MLNQTQVQTNKNTWTTCSSKRAKPSWKDVFRAQVSLNTGIQYQMV